MLNEFLAVLGAVFLGEIGDKTMLVCLWLTTVYAVRPVLIGVIPACFAVPLIGIIIGVAAKTWLPEWAIKLIGAALFFWLVWWSIKEAREEDDFEKKPSRFGIIVDSFVVFFIAEMADRTQFITVAATTQGGSWVIDWLGSALGLVLANLVAVGLFKLAGKNVPRRQVMYIAAVLFLIFGAWLILEAVGLPSTVVAVIICILGMNPWAYRWAAKFFKFAK
ncbi:hypothetical protein A3F27_02030 [Candidatus Kaiserbacteria bacterium RIFCSPHIGHO2_12_FULL_53_13]|uniref:GDT1 family protein n=1 Tax=Candidatus Kaiserbacteria bacterium RIFCSPHIGHO2_12_FULL_53_13 TaxID=1798502 RepID=A0A1F6E8B9_9BACT|nr:MAG: hypothetical protein A3F27_02030 [Candidatus Kaiserbacteria bacterium RIFCSPHIGHO2_12_FULL_53_13]OGG74368.1 MAG: hypothetical protein A3A37_02775 [Candidatus Kaiserbacteria bacterium RIFCSPLOWO2_01_FULL_52_36]